MSPGTTPLPIPPDAIDRRVRQLARRIGRDYRGRHDSTTIMPVMNGAFFFAADLYRHLDPDLRRLAVLATVRTEAYEGTSPRKEIRVSGLNPLDLENRHLLIVEDIVDTGRTLACLTARVRSLARVGSIKVATLLDKSARRSQECPAPDYVGFHVPDEFVVGYGMDCDGRYRGVEGIWPLEQMRSETAGRLPDGSRRTGEGLTGPDSIGRSRR
jgi:hypoxanthine phosphoribosyltransferase